MASTDDTTPVSAAGEDWDTAEISATVASYFAMLTRELQGVPYVKAEENRRLRDQLRGRSAGAVERKHQNITAVLFEMGLPWISGYKPLGNYQEKLADAVRAHLAANPQVETTISAVVDAVPPIVPTSRFADVEVEAPIPRSPSQTVYRGVGRLYDYAARDARNRDLGRRGEASVVEIERNRLTEAGRSDLAAKVSHLSLIEGDGLGYDVRSFEVDGTDRFIEVKTTNLGGDAPFILSANEIEASRQLGDRFCLYRVFSFSAEPRVFLLRGSLAELPLTPIAYRAYFRQP